MRKILEILEVKILLLLSLKELILVQLSLNHQQHICTQHTPHFVNLNQLIIKKLLFLEVDRIELDKE